jgi:hypothetical protein
MVYAPLDYGAGVVHLIEIFCLGGRVTAAHRERCFARILDDVAKLGIGLVMVRVTVEWSAAAGHSARPSRV